MNNKYKQQQTKTEEHKVATVAGGDMLNPCKTLEFSLTEGPANKPC